MIRYVIKRILFLIPILLGASLIIFSIMRLVPGDPARLALGFLAPEEEIVRLREELGLDKPIYIQYLIWLWKALHGDLGRSIMSHRPVLLDIIPRYIATLQLTTAGMCVALFVGITTGVVAATRRSTIFDGLSMAIALLGVSMPTFWLGLLLMLIFSVKLGLFPAGGMGGVEHLVLPALTLGAFAAALIARTTRTSMLEVLSQDYIRTAEAKGLAQRVVVYRHALKNALIPIITVVGIQFGILLGGAVFTETVFSWPGIGRLLVEAILTRDYPLIQGTILVIAASYVIVNLITDLLYALADPRIHYE